MTDKRFPSDPPDRPGWWIMRKDRGIWMVNCVFVLFSRGLVWVHETYICSNDEPGWQFAGRVEMPGEDQ